MALQEAHFMQQEDKTERKNRFFFFTAGGIHARSSSKESQEKTQTAEAQLKHDLDPHHESLKGQTGSCSI